MTGCPPEERLARAALSRIGEPDDRGLRRLVAAEGAVGAWASLRRGDGRSPEGRLTGLLARAAAADPDRDLTRIAALDGRVICPGDVEWPAGLDALDHLEQPAPFALWLRGGGDLAVQAARGVAIVGARAATAYGVRVAGDLSAELAAAGCCVVSGGAYGIDGAAHRGALVADAPTVVVLACGVDVAYPRGHVSIFTQAATEGVIVSEAPPGSVAMRHRFLIRNRLIAALGLGTVVVEAAVRSGALSTAGHAERLSKPVMAVPGPIGSALSAGCHLLIRDRNAILVTSADQVLEVVSPAGQRTLPAPRGFTAPYDELSALCRRLLDVVPARTPAATVRIAVDAGIEPRTATGQLAELAAAGFVERDGAGWRLAPGYRGRAGEPAEP
ncbi:MAG: DNA-processing protein DprA [Frankiaceae bacterium]